MTTPFLTFAVAGNSCAIPLGRVREVVGCRTVVRVPNASDSVRGVMNLRGSVVPVIDLARRLGVGETALCDTTCAVLMEMEIDGDTAAIAGLVDEIRAVIDLDTAAFATTPQFGTPVDTRLVSGVAAEGERFSYVLDLDAILASIT